jgi:hypothetical protein
MAKITSKTKLAKILEMKNGEKILHKNGVPCVTCPYAEMEINELEIGKVCKAYKLDAKKILSELNEKK